MKSSRCGDKYHRLLDTGRGKLVHSRLEKADDPAWLRPGTGAEARVTRLKKILHDWLDYR